MCHKAIIYYEHKTTVIFIDHLNIRKHKSKYGLKSNLKCVSILYNHPSLDCCFASKNNLLTLN